MPSESDLRKAYASEYAASPDAMHDGGRIDPVILNRDHERYHRGIVDAVKATGVAGPILEVGSGFGGLCEQALRAGLSWEGVELSEQAVDYCQRTGLPVRRAELAEIHDKLYSAIVMCFVFEHLSNHDDFLATCRERLLPEGRIITLNPTAHFPRLFGNLLRLGDKRRPLPRLDSAFVPPWHTVLISLRGMHELAKRNGFCIERVLPTPTGRFGSIGRRTAQSTIECVNGIGWKAFGERWPLLPAHLIVARAA
jgi:SAM-dependent methyltransferase